MATPLEGKIADDFEELLLSDETIPSDLAQEVAALVRGEDAPTHEALLEVITSHVGETPHD